MENLTAEQILEGKTWPKRNTKFTLEDFFQTDVDEFHSGDFLFLSAKDIELKTSDKLFEMVESVDERGWIISTYCYTTKAYTKILLFGCRAKAWQNGYHIRYEIAFINNADYAFKEDCNDFIDWMSLLSTPIKTENSPDIYTKD